MQNSLVRNIIVLIVLIWGVLNVYPTIGWLSLSEESRTQRLEKWRAEDEVYVKRSPFQEGWKSLRRWADFDRSRVVNLGLDLQGGIHIVLGLEMDKMDPVRKKEYIEDIGYTEAMLAEHVQQIALQRIERRVSEFEAQEPIIQTLGNNQIQIQLPGEKDLERARVLVTRTAYLTFHLVGGPEASEKTFASIEQQYKGRFLPFCQRSGTRGLLTVSPENLERVRTVVAEAEAAGAIEGDWAVRFGPKPRPDQPQVYTMYVVQKTPLISGEGLRKAVAMPDQQSASGSWQILFENSPESAQKFGEITQAHLQEAMAIVVDDVVVSAPTIQAKITTGGTITGSFTMEEAKDLSIALESGSMPVPVREDYVGVVSASLGNEAIQSGITSSVLGVIAVCIFMIAYYHIGGIIAIISLIANGMLLLAALSYINATLTLPGIAGMMLTLGMAVDANVLIYERLREEFRLGKSLASSVEAAFSRASSAIIDSNVTTLIAAAVLMEFGTGPVEGFAVALSIGIFTSVFTAVVLSKVMFDFVVARRPAGKLSMLSVFKEQTNIPFMGMRYKAYVISAIMIAVGLGYFAFRGNENFGVDFRTGTNLTVGVGANAEVPVESVREALASAGFNSPTVQGLGENAENRFLLRLAEIDAAISSAEQQAAGQSDAVQNTVASRVQKALAPLVSADAAPEVVTLENVQTVGPAVSNQLKIDTMWAILYSLIFIGLYMWYRFDWKYAVGGILALLHDTFITVGLLALTQREVSLTVVAAILTVIGYSLNDTIVVYDRIREDLRLYRGRGYTLAQIMDISINQTLSRTILTSLCTLFVVTVLFFYGGPVLNDFAFVLAVGIIVGTFSSIFVASPFVLMLEKVNIGRGKKAEGSEEPKQGGGRHRRGTRRSSEAETV